MSDDERERARADLQWLLDDPEGWGPNLEKIAIHARRDVVAGGRGLCAGLKGEQVSWIESLMLATLALVRASRAGVTARLPGVPDRLAWTHEWPTVPGWYWWQYHASEGPRVVEVFVEGGRVWCEGALGEYEPEDLEAGAGRWSGPIPAPDGGGPWPGIAGD